MLQLTSKETSAGSAERDRVIHLAPRSSLLTVGPRDRGLLQDEDPPLSQCSFSRWEL